MAEKRKIPCSFCVTQDVCKSRGECVQKDAWPAAKHIFFSGAMVRAILAGHKTQTRRLRNLDEINKEPDVWHFCSLNGYGNAVFTKDERAYTEIKNPYGDAGENLWVRETWQKWENGGRQVAYAADLACWEVAFGESEPSGVFDDGFRLATDPGRWKPSIHMPRWASRLNLEITNIRVERVQDISEADAIAEGIQVLPLQSESDPSAWYQSAPGIHQERSAKASYRSLWDSINSKRGFGWDKNPWVWAITFKRAEPTHAE